MTRSVEAGDDSEAVPPPPICPKEPSPQHMTRRSSVRLVKRAQVVPPPVPELVDTETSKAVHPGTVDTLTGSLEVTAPTPFPSCPSIATPQHLTVLPVTAHPWVSPTSNDVTLPTPEPIEVPVGLYCEFPMTIGEGFPAIENSRLSWSSSK